MSDSSGSRTTDGSKICVVLGHERVSTLLARHRQLVAEGVGLVEWRLDHLSGPVDVAGMLAQRPGPVIVTWRRPDDGGKRATNEELRVAKLHAAIEAEAEYVDLEPDVAEKLTLRSSSRRIVSIHDFTGTPDDLQWLHARLSGAGADVVKIATLARSASDSLRMLRMVRESRLPTVGLCMGEFGLPSRLLAGRFGAPWSYAADTTGQPLAPGQLDWRTMRDVYGYEEVSPNAELYGVIGDPIGHSKSPLIHNAAFRALGLDKFYVPFRVLPDELLGFLDDARALGVRGLSVTIPHKEGILARVTEAEDAVRAIGAANTLVFDGSKVCAWNTDCRAALDSLTAAIPGSSLTGKRALVLGAGGAAKAIVCGLRQAGAQVTIAARTLARAEELASALDAQAVAWEARHDVRPDVLVNCTPLGMSPHVDATPFDAPALSSSMVVFDTVYNPQWTRLLVDARAAGATVVTGIEMFVRQAARQFELFTGRPAPVEVMRSALVGAARRSGS